MAQTAAPPAQPKVADLGWWAGNWRGSLEGNTVERSCSAPRGGAIMCMMRVIVKEQVVWMEFSTLRETPKGVVLDTRFFTGDGQPGDPVSNELVLKSSTAKEALFENPNGTQPKSESVTLTGPDSMTSHADLIDSKGKASALDLTWTRMR